MSALVSRRQAIACSGAVLVAHVGLAHEVIGAVLYPYGPAVFGGPVGWHAAGLSAVASGLLMAVGVLGFVRVPVVLLATGASAAGWIVFVAEALWHGGFHFFAFTLGVAGAVVAVAGR